MDVRGTVKAVKTASSCLKMVKRRGIKRSFTSSDFNSEQPHVCVWMLQEDQFIHNKHLFIMLPPPPASQAGCTAVSDVTSSHYHPGSDTKRSPKTNVSQIQGEPSKHQLPLKTQDITGQV